MLIAQISDTHILAQTSDHPSAELRADCLRRTVADINGLRPNAVIFTGDTTQHGAPGEYARLRDLLAPLEAPLYPTPGNRDDKEAMRAAFAGHPQMPREGSFLHYTVEHHDIRLVAIDSTAPGERKGRFCQARQRWLDKVLAEAPDRPTLLFIHHPPFDVGDHYVGGYRRPEESAALAAVAKRHACIAGLVCGHVHWLIECTWAGVPARIMPSIAVDLRKGIDEDKARERPIYLLHRISEAGEVLSTPRTVGA